jgi:uncharacterized repeat protein (TIGR03803 family)
MEILVNEKGSGLMKYPMQHRSCVLGIRGRVTGAALAFAIMLVLGVLATGSAQAQTYTYGVLYSFKGSPDGAFPVGGLNARGTLYATTFYGGDYNYGTVVKLDRTGKETVLYSFTGTKGDGAYPFAALVGDAGGNVYGTTEFGGDLACNPPNGCGTVFKWDRAGKETVLHSFLGSPEDGSVPESGLVLDARGNLYGTTPYGGAFDMGTVFKVDTTNHETVRWSFSGGADGGNPTSVLVLDGQGNLYGTTRNGGVHGDGTVFKVDTSGNETVLYSFRGGADGSSPRGSLVWDAQGNLYGHTKSGGVHGNGTLFKLDVSTLIETVLYSFAGGADGDWPGDIVLDAQGSLYGTTQLGGDLACNAPNGCGTAFKLDATGAMTVLYSFSGTAGDGETPGGLIRDAQGNLYGGTLAGGDPACTVVTGTEGCGTLFKLTPRRSLPLFGGR